MNVTAGLATEEVMKTIAFLSLLLGVAAACGSSEASDVAPGAAPQDPSDPRQTGGTGDGGGESKGPGDAALSPGDGSSPPPPGPDGSATDPTQPHPPPGFTQCQQGTFSAEEAHVACESFVVNSPTRPKSCDGATSSGGAWEIWCSGNQRWVFARFDDVLATSAFTKLRDRAALRGSLATGRQRRRRRALGDPGRVLDDESHHRRLRRERGRSA